MELLIVNFGLLGLLIWREIQHDRATKDLLNRLMARDYNEYQVGLEQKPPPRGRNFVKYGLQRSINMLHGPAQGGDN